MLLLLEFGVLSEEDVELVLEAGEDKFCDTVDDVFACFPGGDVFTDNGDVRPDVLDVTVALLLFALGGCALRGGLLRVGAPPVVLRSCGEATLVEDVESAYLQLAAGLG